MASQLSADAKRVADIVDEIAIINHTISYLEYEICDVLDDVYEIKDKQDEQRRYQKQVNEIEDDLEDDYNVKIEYDGKLTQVYRNGVLWLEHHEGYDLSIKQEWNEYQPPDSTIIRNRRVAFLTGFAWDRVSDELLDEVMTFMKAHGFDAVK